jgi:hypothetical protein
MQIMLENKPIEVPEVDSMPVRTKSETHVREGVAEATKEIRG